VNGESFCFLFPISNLLYPDDDVPSRSLLRQYCPNLGPIRSLARSLACRLHHHDRSFHRSIDPGHSKRPSLRVRRVQKENLHQTLGRTPTRRPVTLYTAPSTPTSTNNSSDHPYIHATTPIQPARYRRQSTSTNRSPNRYTTGRDIYLRNRPQTNVKSAPAAFSTTSSPVLPGPDVLATTSNRQ
jgi:hypothetical protein